MRVGLFILLSCIFTALTARAQEKLPSLEVGTNVYRNITVLSISQTDVFFATDKGKTNAKLKILDPVWQRHFNYDPVKAEAAERRQKTTNLKQVRPAAPNPAVERTKAKALMDKTIEQVKDIVNQPVTQLTRTRNMRVMVVSPGWFHEGAIRPDFNTVDIRVTQEMPYLREAYVTSDLNPDVVFIGAELEFNAMTKYFYDRSLPKKKLTEAEMIEVNRLYRIIGKCEAVLKPRRTN